MTDIINKSLEKYVEECISQFVYSDFSPPVDNHKLASKFSEILNRENVYWEEYKPEDTWPKWVFIQFKSFTNTSTHILGLNFDKNKITFTLTDRIDNKALTEQKNRTEINLFDIWLDHNKLFQKLFTIVREGISKSNSA